MHGHGTWSMVFTSHQEPGSLISGRGWRCPTVVCSWSPVTLGPAFELVTLRGGFGRRRGSLSLDWSWSHWIWSMRMVHSVAASEHTAVCNQLWQGAHTLLGEHFECVRRAAQGASYEGERAHGAALSAYRSQHKPGGEVARTEAPVDGVVPTLPVDEASDEADMIRRKDEWRRDVSHPNLGTASLRGMSKTPTALSPARDSF